MPLDYTSHLQSDGERMARAVALDLDAHVPTCPKWNVAKLTIHTGLHHRWVADAVRRRGTPPDEPRKPGLRGDALVEWFREGWRDLADLLDATDDAAPAWTWSGDHRAGFWRRRTALETLVHRWDAENATGAPAALDRALADDGIDEMLFVMMAQGGAYTGPGLRVAVAPTDTPSRWLLDLDDAEPPRAARANSDDADVSLRGEAGDLLLFLWGRLGRDAVDLSGDAAARDVLLRWVSG